MSGSRDILCLAPAQAFSCPNGEDSSPQFRAGVSKRPRSLSTKPGEKYGGLSESSDYLNTISPKARGSMAYRTFSKLIVFALCVTNASLWAQTPTLRGVVTDPSGAVVPNAALTLKGPSGLDKMTVTGDNGSYAFTGLPPGTYKVAASAPELTLPQVFRVPQRRIVVTPRADYQLNSQNTLTVRYIAGWANIADADIGSFNLVSQGYDIRTRSGLLQATETMVIGTSAVNETRSQYSHVANGLMPNSTGPAIQVLGSFNGGAAPIGNSSDVQNTYELHNYTSIVGGHHTWRFGARLRGATDRNVSRLNSAGTFTFGGGLAPELDASNQPIPGAGGQPLEVDISSIERYQCTLQLQRIGLTADQIRVLGGGASQFTISAGNPSVTRAVRPRSIRRGRLAPESEPDSLGMRYETRRTFTTGAISPRVSGWRGRLAAARTRAQDGASGRLRHLLRPVRFGQYEASLLYNGVVQQQYIITNPDLSGTTGDFAFRQQCLGTQFAIASAVPVVVSRGHRAETPANTTVAVTYANSHGLHLLRSDDINTPLPGTLIPR